MELAIQMTSCHLLSRTTTLFLLAAILGFPILVLETVLVILILGLNYLILLICRDTFIRLIAAPTLMLQRISPLTLVLQRIATPTRDQRSRSHITISSDDTVASSIELTKVRKENTMLKVECGRLQGENTTLK